MSDKWSAVKWEQHLRYSWLEPWDKKWPKNELRERRIESVLNLYVLLSNLFGDGIF